MTSFKMRTIYTTDQYHIIPNAAKNKHYNGKKVQIITNPQITKQQNNYKQINYQSKGIRKLFEKNDEPRKVRRSFDQESKSPSLTSLESLTLSSPKNSSMQLNRSEENEIQDDEDSKVLYDNDIEFLLDNTG